MARYYTRTHEWVTVGDDGIATVGITDYAQEQLGDVVFVELPQQGKLLEAGDGFGTIESVKSASDLFSPVAGSVVEVNEALADSPEAVNEDPFGRGWMVKIRLNGDLGDSLLDEQGYRAEIEAQQ
ncbi:MAG: glycine cleavage system protein GcvH [Candidatus Dormibacteraeota bacterium]|nr:glycine cleavage system protein GcvH [Candidatus Dormibacteraeota bacterium]